MSNFKDELWKMLKDGHPILFMLCLFLIVGAVILIFNLILSAPWLLVLKLTARSVVVGVMLITAGYAMAKDGEKIPEQTFDGKKVSGRILVTLILLAVGGFFS